MSKGKERKKENVMLRLRLTVRVMCLYHFFERHSTTAPQSSVEKAIRRVGLTICTKVRDTE